MTNNQGSDCKARKITEICPKICTENNKNSSKKKQTVNQCNNV